MSISRRSALLMFTGAAASSMLCPSLVFATTVRQLNFENLHTGERLISAYRTEAGYDTAALSDINYILRDWRTGEINAIAPALLDDIYDIQRLLGHHGVIKIISGYRSPRTNAALSSKNRGVAKRSLHMQGRAVDIALQGVSTLNLRDAALALKRGGVGTYSKSGFVHLDTGRVRRWGS